MNLILLGAPFSGKGTLAKKLVEEFGFVQVSTGDLFRENIKKETKVGLLAKQYIDKGQLVPVVFDGFPRTVKQAEELEKISKVDAVIQLDAPFEIIKRRCLGRRVCSKCGEIYSTSTYSKTTCQKCGSPLFQRDDDNLETLNNRLEVYENMTTPLINFYADRLFVVDGSKTPEATFESVKNFLKGSGK